MLMRISWLLWRAGISLSLSLSAVSAAEVHAYLYNPAVDSAVYKYPYTHPDRHVGFHPFLAMMGQRLDDLGDGDYQLSYNIESGGTALQRGTAAIRIQSHAFAKEFTLEHKCPEADHVHWELRELPSRPRLEGEAPLKWSRFNGTVKFKDPSQSSSVYIELHTYAFEAPGSIEIPVDPDGHFDARVPSRVYKVLNVVGTGYAYNSMERWGWDYDLITDKQEEFTIGRMEIYGMHAFEITGGAPTLLIAFRPSTLSRILKFDLDRDGQRNEKEQAALEQALRHSYTAIGPELKAENVKAWIDGKPYPVAQLTQMPEFDGNGIYQVLYVAQLYLEQRLRGMCHEVKIEVESEEDLDGRKMRDWGQGSVGYCTPIF